MQLVHEPLINLHGKYHQLGFLDVWGMYYKCLVSRSVSRYICARAQEYKEERFIG